LGHRAHAGGGASCVVVVVILRVTLAVVLGVGEGSETRKEPKVLLELHVDFCCLLTWGLWWLVLTLDVVSRMDVMRDGMLRKENVSLGSTEFI